MMSKLIAAIRKFLVSEPREEGATMVEYGLMVALIAVVCVTAVALMGTSIKGIFTSMAGSF